MANFEMASALGRNRGWRRLRSGPFPITGTTLTVGIRSVSTSDQKIFSGDTPLSFSGLRIIKASHAKNSAGFWDEMLFSINAMIAKAHNNNGGGLNEASRVTTNNFKQTQLGETEGTKQFVSVVADAGNGLELHFRRATSCASAQSAVQENLDMGDACWCTIEISAQLLQEANSIIEAGNPWAIRLLHRQ